MTLLSIANDVADETKGPRPETIVGNTSPDAQNILRVINRVGINLMRAYGWNILRKEQTFTSVSGEEQTGALPSDFDRFVPETFWDRDSNNLMSGPVSPVEWAGLKVQTFSSQNKKFVHRGGSIFTQPELGSGVNMAFEYISKNWCQDSSSTAQAKFAADDDTAIIDEDLITYGAIFEWLDAEGQPSVRAARAYHEYFNLLVNNERATADILVAGDVFAQNTRHFEGAPKPSRASYGGDF